jgi:type I restriction enzyme S subunit
MVRTVPIAEVSAINPRPPAGLNEEVAFVPMASVSENGTMRVSEHRQARSMTNGFSYFQTGDVLIAKITPCFENNKITLAELDCKHGFGSTEFHVVRPDAKRLDRRYLFHFLRQDRIRRAGEQRMTGSGGQKRVPKQFFAELGILLPDLPEQRRIAAMLDLADALRRKRRICVDRLGALRTGYFLKKFGDPRLNDMEWPTLRLGEAGSLDRGVSKHRPRNDPSLLGGPHPLIQTGDVAAAGDYVRAFSSTYSDAGLRQSRIWPKGTLCITIAANIGQTAILEIAACFPDSIVGFTPHSNCSGEYVQTCFSFLQQSLEDAAPQFAQKNINLAILRSLKIPFPPRERQSEYADFARLLSKEKLRQQANLRTLDALFASFQRDLFSMPSLAQQRLAAE